LKKQNNSLEFCKLPPEYVQYKEYSMPKEFGASNKDEVVTKKSNKKLKYLIAMMLRG